MTSILIGAPIYGRSWILPKWTEAIGNQNFPKDKLGFVFELGPDDDETHNLLWEWQTNNPQFVIFDAQIDMHTTHHSHPDGERIWNLTKYQTMANLRNSLLERATEFADSFDYYFSLDSDILLEDPETLNRLVSYAEQDCSRSVISPLMYMTPYDTNFPSAMSWEDRPGGRAVRTLDKYKTGELFEVDIVMAAVFMQKEVFTQNRYYPHRQGEDLGFATDLADTGRKSFAAWDIYCPHIMHRSALDDYINCGMDLRKPT